MSEILSTKPKLGSGVYTVSDASHILNIPTSKLRRWINEYWKASFIQNKNLADNFYIWGESRDIAFNFYTLIEIFTVMSLRHLGVTFKTIISAREELSEIFNTEYPFAFENLMSDGKKIIITLDRHKLLELGTYGQTALKEIIEPFCQKLDFDINSELARRYWPLGRDSSVVVDPKHGFGRPTLLGTNISTEVINSLISAGEPKEDIAHLYDISLIQINDVFRFENLIAA